MPSRQPEVGEWVCMFGKVTATHGDKQVVVQVGSIEVTMLNGEVWNPDIPPTGIEGE